jgi:kumamolisin
MAHELFPGWTPVQIAHHYNFPMASKGSGQTIAIIDLGESLELEEVMKDFKYLRAPYPKIEVIHIGEVPKQAGSALETHLDIQVVGCICPDASIKVYRAALTIDGMTAAIARAVKDDVDVISISWGGRENAIHQGLEEALSAAHKANITVCVATGDFGSSQYSIGRAPAAAPDGLSHCGYPATSPLVLACGGTQLVLNDDGISTEVVWNNTLRGGRATGGGVSKLYDLPKWQGDAGIKIASTNKGEGVGRVIPDVAGLAAAGDWQIGIDGGDKELIGGTSAIAPMWAAFFALVNQMRLGQGKKRLGFVNERLYALAAKENLFIDIDKGNNKSTPDYPGYEAGKGFDACTGWGSPRGKHLAEALVALD